jgi:hypothetical protein
MEIPVPILSSVIGALAAIVVLFLKELLDRRKTEQTAAMSITWLALSIKHSITKDVESLSHIDLGILRNSASSISQSRDLRAASFLLQEVYCLWKAQAYLRKDLSSPIVAEASNKLDRAITLAGGSANEA